MVGFQIRPMNYEKKSAGADKTMSFLDNLENAIHRDDEITLFDTSDKGYYAYTRRGDRFDITHAFNFQPPILNFDDYYAYMFVESLQGFFIFRQRIFENAEEHWEVFLELFPREPAGFFADAWSFHLELKENQWKTI
jgi:hypothetical protein